MKLLPILAMMPLGLIIIFIMWVNESVRFATIVMLLIVLSLLSFVWGLFQLVV